MFEILFLLALFARLVVLMVVGTVYVLMWAGRGALLAWRWARRPKPARLPPVRDMREAYRLP